MEAKKTLLSTLMVSGLVLGGYAGLAHTQHQDFNTNFTAIAHADATEGTIMKFSDGCSVVAKRDDQGKQVYDYVTKDGITNQIPNTTNMTVAGKSDDKLVLEDDTGYTVVEPGGGMYTAPSLKGYSQEIADDNKDPNCLYLGVSKWDTIGNVKIPTVFTFIMKTDNGKYYVKPEYTVTTGGLTSRKDADGKIMSAWTAMAPPMTAALSGDADVSTADNGDVTIKFNPSDQGYATFLQRQDGTYTNNLLSRGKSASSASASSISSLNLSANEINTANDGKDKVSRVITYSIQTPDGLKQVGSYTYSGAENQFNADQVAQKNLPKGYKIVQMLAVPTVGADGSNDPNAFTYLVEKSSDASSSSVTPAAASSTNAKASSTVASIVGDGNVSDVNHSSVSASSVAGQASSAKSDLAKGSEKDGAVSASSESASSVSKSDAKDVSGAVKGSSSAKTSSVVSSSESSHSMSSKSVSSEASSSKSGLSKSSSSKVESSSDESSKSSSLAESASSKSAESDKNSSVSDKDTNAAVASSSQNVSSQSSSVIGQAGTAGQSGQNGGSSAAPEANTTNPGDGTTTTTSTSTTPGAGDDTYSPQKAAMLAKTNAKAAESGIIAAIGAVIGTVAGWFGLKKKNN